MARVFYDVVRNGGGMAFGTYFDRRVKRILDGDFSPTFAAELMLKDAGLALDLARSAKVPTPMLEETQKTYGEAVAGGWGKEDFSAVTHVIEKRIGRRISQKTVSPSARHAPIDSPRGPGAQYRAHVHLDCRNREVDEPAPAREPASD